MASIKLTDIVKTFDGSGKIDVVEWIKKAEMVARMQKVENLTDFIPLFLEGPAFSVYEQLTDEDKASYDNVKLALLSAFSLTPHQAYELFRARDLTDEETIDGYLAELRRLMSLIGSKDEAMLCCQFVAGLPEEVATQVKSQQAGVQNINALFKCAKAVLADKKVVGIGAAGMSWKTRGSNSGEGPGKGGQGQGQGSRRSQPPPERKSGTAGSSEPALRCLGCNRRGHAVQDCNGVCNTCGKKGHFSFRCEQFHSIQRNDQGASSRAPPVTRQE